MLGVVAESYSETQAEQWQKAIDRAVFQIAYISVLDDDNEKNDTVFVRSHPLKLRETQDRLIELGLESTIGVCNMFIADLKYSTFENKTSLQLEKNFRIRAHGSLSKFIVRHSIEGKSWVEYETSYRLDIKDIFYDLGAAPPEKTNWAFFIWLCLLSGIMLMLLVLVLLRRKQRSGQVGRPHNQEPESHKEFNQQGYSDLIERVKKLETMLNPESKGKANQPKIRQPHHPKATTAGADFETVTQGMPESEVAEIPPTVDKVIEPVLSEVPKSEKATRFYLPIPESESEGFLAEYASDDFKEVSSVFLFTLDRNNPNRASFIVTGEQDVIVRIQKDVNSLFMACERIGMHREIKAIVTDTPGRVELIDGYWKVTRKAVISFT